MQVNSQNTTDYLLRKSLRFLIKKPFISFDTAQLLG